MYIGKEHHMDSYGVCETKYAATNTICHIARNSHDVLNVRALCGMRISWQLGDYDATPSGWNLCQRCEKIRCS